MLHSKFTMDRNTDSAETASATVISGLLCAPRVEVFRCYYFTAGLMVKIMQDRGLLNYDGARGLDTNGHLHHGSISVCLPEQIWQRYYKSGKDITNLAKIFSVGMQ